MWRGRWEWEDKQEMGVKDEGGREAMAAGGGRAKMQAGEEDGCREGQGLVLEGKGGAE